MTSVESSSYDRDSIDCAENNEEIMNWTFCNNIVLPRSEVVFFVQMFFVATVLIICFLKLVFSQNLDCEERIIWVSLL